MAKDIKRISITKFESTLDEDNIVTVPLHGAEDVFIEIRKTLPLYDMTAFVQEIVESCIDGETGEYLPEAYDFAIRVGVLTHYANFAMPTNLEKQYRLVYETHAFDQVASNINNCQFNDMIRAIDRKISFMLNVISSSAVTKINDIIAKFNDIAETSATAFNGASAEDISKVVAGISKLKDLNEADIAKVILQNHNDGDSTVTVENEAK